MILAGSSRCCRNILQKCSATDAMEWIQTLLESSATPALTAFLLGVLTALSPCPLATNIAAIGYISRNIESRSGVFLQGMLYTLGRTIAYTFLGIVLIVILKSGTSMFGIQEFIADYSEMILPPALLLVGVFMLLGNRLRLPSAGIGRGGEGLARKGGLGALILGMLFAMAFCPTSGVFYFGMLIPMSASARLGYLLPVVFAISTALPVLIVAWILAFGARHIGNVYGKMRVIQKWLNTAVAILFMAIGVYYCITIYI